MRILGIIASAVKKGFSDTFNRTTSGSLGTSSSGGLWEAIRGVWYANGSQATSVDSSSTYPIATYDMQNQNVTINLDTSQGTGTAFWVTNSQNWWGAYSWQQSVCNAWTSTCSGWASYCQTSSCTSWVIGYVGPGSYAPVCSGYTCTGFASFCSSPGSTCISFTGGQRYLRIIKSVTNTVTTVLDQAVASAVLSLKTVLSGDTITISAYSSAGQVNQIGSNIVNTPVSPTKGTKHGLILAPGVYSQGTTADNISIS